VVHFVAAVRPVIPPSTEAALESPPELEAEAPAMLPEIAPSRAQPPRPRVAAPVAQEPVGPKRTEPTIAPEVPTEEMMAAKAETQHNLDIAEKNLAMTQGKTLNAAQQDLASKVRGFADNAREAMSSGDWVKAKNLSSKAEVLSEELAASF